jgi:hypothetical protein
MNIRHALPEDIERILLIYARAREAMRRSGNPTQWGDGKPARETVEADIQQGNLYVIEQEGAIAGVFAFILGEDATYRAIEGQWLNTFPYGTVHRVASSGRVGGILEACIGYCAAVLPNIRIDTHQDNRIMQYLLEKLGFCRCGIIHVEDGSPRIAYQRQGEAPVFAPLNLPAGETQPASAPTE